MKRFSNIVDKNKKKNMIGISCITASAIIISSAIIFSFPNINFASIQEDMFNNEIANNTILEENVIDNSVLVEDNNEAENEEKKFENRVISKNVAAIPELICPLENYTITSRFGKRSNGIHTGLDFNAVQGTPIRAAASGTVIYSGYKGSYGNLVIIDHGNEFQTYYAQCKDLNVEVNEKVEQGDIIATVGSSGSSTGPHLHFETRNNNTPVNPQKILNYFNALNP